MENLSEYQPVEITDIISNLKFSPTENTNKLIATSCDGYMYLLNLDSTNKNLDLLNKLNFVLPQLDCCFDENNCDYTYSVGLDKNVKKVNLEKSETSILGSHTKTSNCVLFSKEVSGVISSGRDNFIRIWDSRQKKNLFYDTSMKISKIILSGGRLVLAGIENEINVIKFYNLRNLSAPEKAYESPLKFLTTSLAPTNVGDGFIIGSIEGKVAVEFFDKQNENIINSNYMYKCHREQTETSTIAYPINAISFHPLKNIFYTGGSDRYVNCWDNSTRKKLFKSSTYPAAINSLAINYDGKFIAIASSYLPQEFYTGNNILIQNSKHQIFIKNIQNL